MLQVADDNLQSNWLVKWFRKKYNFPPRSLELEKYTREEIYVEYLEDLIEQHDGDAEAVALNVGTKADPIYVHPMASPEMQKSEERLARGDSEDMFEGLPEDTVAEIKAHMNRKKPPSLPDLEFSDDYTKGL